MRYGVIQSVLVKPFPFWQFSGIKTLLQRGLNAPLLSAAAIAVLHLSTCIVLADELITFDFGQDVTATQTAAHISYVTKFSAVHSAAVWDSIGQAMYSDTWKLDNPTNLLHFSFILEPGYVADIERLEFDYKSAVVMSIAFGPNKYNVSYGSNGGTFQSLSGGWRSLTVDNAWHRGIAVTNGGAVVSNLSGYVVIALAGEGANDPDMDWYLDNVKVYGQIRPSPSIPTRPAISALIPLDRLQLVATSTQQYYSLQYSSRLDQPWQHKPSRANIIPSGSSLNVDIADLVGSPLFLRIRSSFARMAAVDLSGFWLVSSSNSFFRKGVMRFEQPDETILFERAIIGKVEDTSFLMGLGGLALMTGTLTNDHLRGQYNIPMSGTSVTGSYEAIRYEGPMYDVWQGTNALTSSKYYDPGLYGYEKVGESSTTTTFSVSKPFLVLCANTMAPIDALEGNTGVYLNVPGVLSIWSANTRNYALSYGAPDSSPALVGNGFSEQTHRGYIAFGTVAWTSLTVHVVTAPGL